MKSTLFIIGPSGVGKSNLDDLFSNQVIRLDPYRLREEGPRKEQANAEVKSKDIHYAPLKLKEDLEAIFKKADEQGIALAENIIWYRQFKTLVFKVRKTWQILNLLALEQHPNARAKAEVYSSLIPHLIASSKFDFLGEKHIVILNPYDRSLMDLDQQQITDFIQLVKEGLLKRGTESEASASRRAASIREELPIWQQLLSKKYTKVTITELVNWPYSEYLYQEQDPAELLALAKQRLIAACPDIAIYT